MKFCALQDDYCWGSETFGVADLGYRDSLVRDGWLAGNLMSEVMDTYIDRVVGDDVYSWYGRQFPVCIRTIKCNGRMPLRVHPDDVVAGQRFDLLGKEKLWIVLRCGQDARVCIGFKEDCDASSVWQGCLDGSIEQLLNIVAPHPGQHFHIAPGTPHTLMGDIEVLEISEASSADICMCPWGQELGSEEFDDSITLVDALDFIDYKAWKSGECCCGHHHHHEEEIVHELLDIPQMKVNMLRLTDPLHIYGEQFGSFILYCCLGGEASVQIEVLGQTARFPFAEGECILVPVECSDFFLVPTDRDTRVIEVSIPPREDKDEYINPDVADHLEGEEDDCDDDDCDCGCGHHHHHS